jgi:hypothetical protein
MPSKDRVMSSAAERLMEMSETNELWTPMNDGAMIRGAA